MATKLPSVDIAFVGWGLTAGIIAKELASTNLKIVALERGRARTSNPDYIEANRWDELTFPVRNQLMVDTRRETISFRHKSSDTALPMRKLGSFLPGEGDGGASVHWGGNHWRWTEWDQQAHKTTVEKWGAKVIPADMQLQDWPWTYAEIESYYDAFEKMCGVSGKAGNLNGQKVAGGNVFEGPRKNEYPQAALTYTYPMMEFAKAATNLGYHTFPVPASNSSGNYTNPDGMSLAQCHYCGYCAKFGCEANAKASAELVFPLALKNPNMQVRNNARVLKVNLDSDKKKAVSVSYLDAAGREFEQPADLIVLSAFAFNNVHLMLLSGIGKPYDPTTGKGVVGRNYAYQCSGGVAGFYDSNTWVNPFMGAGSSSMTMDDVASDNYDVGKFGYLGDGSPGVGTSGANPIQYHPVPPGTPKWGSAWKKAVAENFNHAIGLGGSGAVMSYKQNYLDLDPTYKDGFGRPLLRMTFDFQDNEIKLMKNLGVVAEPIAQAMGLKNITHTTSPIPYSLVPYQSTHNTSGAVFGDDPSTSALNKYCQSWDVPNVFVTGACVFPQNSSKNPTGPVGALAIMIGEVIRDKYLKSPDKLVHA